MRRHDAVRVCVFRRKSVGNRSRGTAGPRWAAEHGGHVPTSDPSSDIAAKNLIRSRAPSRRRAVFVPSRAWHPAILSAMKRLVLRNSFFSFVRRRDGPERHGSFQEPAFSVAGELAWVCETVAVWERQRPRLLGTSRSCPREGSRVYRESAVGTSVRSAERRFTGGLRCGPSPVRNITVPALANGTSFECPSFRRGAGTSSASFREPRAHQSRSRGSALSEVDVTRAEGLPL